MTFHFQTCREPSDLIPAVLFSLSVLCRPVFCSFEFPHRFHVPCYVFPACLFDVRGEFEAAVWTFLSFLFMFGASAESKCIIQCFIPYYMVFIYGTIYGSFVFCFFELL